MEKQIPTPARLALVWFPVALGTAVAAHWYFRVPTVGKGGLSLAVVATIMPILWEKADAIAKSAWIALLFALFVVEYRAIEADRANFVEEQRQAMREDRARFLGISNGLAAGVEQSQRQFYMTMRGVQKTIRSSSQAVNLARQGIDNITGGTSHVEVYPFPSAIDQTGAIPLFVAAVGENPVWDGRLEIWNVQDSDKGLEEFRMGEQEKREFLGIMNGIGERPEFAYVFPRPLNPHYFEPLPHRIRPRPEQTTTYVINISARNRPTTQILHIRQNPTTKEWEFSYRVTVLTSGKNKVGAQTIVKDTPWWRF